MNDRGFTLVELLAVIVILAILAVLTSMSVTKVVRGSKSDLYNAQIELIKSATETWGADNLNKLPEDGTCKYITLGALKDYGLLDNDIKNPKTNKKFSDDLKIKITSELTTYGTSILEYEVDSKSVNDCEYVYPPICTAVTTATTGNIPTGNYNPGDEYTCEVKPGTSYTFFVISEKETNVNLIMYANINESGIPVDSNDVEDNGVIAWINADDYNDGMTVNTNKGPITALKYLQTATSSWINIPNIKMNYTDEGNAGIYGYGDIKTENNITKITMKDGKEVVDKDGIVIKYKNLKARMPELIELQNSGCNNESEECPLWLFNYIGGAEVNEKIGIDNVVGYYSLSSYSGESLGGLVWRISPTGSVDLMAFNSNFIGIRPVISIPKHYIKN